MSKKIQESPEFKVNQRVYDTRYKMEGTIRKIEPEGDYLVRYDNGEDCEVDPYYLRSI